MPVPMRFASATKFACSGPTWFSGADIIVGFPTETDEHFADSMKLVEDCGITHLHVFPYSARPETAAARMPAVPGEIVKMRAARLRAAGDEALRTHLDRQVGRHLRGADGARRTGTGGGFYRRRPRRHCGQPDDRCDRHRPRRPDSAWRDLELNLERDSTVEAIRPENLQFCRAIIMFLISAMALAGLRPLGQALAQFMIVWQR